MATSIWFEAKFNQVPCTNRFASGQNWQVRGTFEEQLNVEGAKEGDYLFSIKSDEDFVFFVCCIFKASR